MSRYNPPPNWPTPPNGWTPPPDWKPNPAWGPPPAGWQVWVEDYPSQPVQQRSWFVRHKILTAIGAIVAVSVIGSAIGSGGNDTASPGLAPGSPSSASAAGTTSPTASAKAISKADSKTSAKATDKQPTKAASAAGIGDKVRDGSFEFTVKTVTCGVQQVGDSYLNKKAQGQFCVISLKVTNIGDDSSVFNDSDQKLINSRQQTFSTDSEAAIYLDDSNSFLEEINPGNSVTGKIVFDIPKNAKPETLELHDDRLFSGGAEVSLD